MNQPLVSICIPTCNGAKYLNEALRSIEKQTYKNFEVVISDDDSNDNTVKIIEEFTNKVLFPVRIYFHSPSTIGANWNNCIRKAKSEFIKFLFQDDVLYPTCIEEMMLALIKDKNIGLVACKRDFLVEGKRDSVLNEWIETYQNLQINMNFPQKRINILDKRMFRNKNFIKVPQNKIGEPTAVLFRKSTITKIGYFREDLQQILDAEFYYRLLKQFKIAIINDELVAFRLHPLQATNVNRNKPINDYMLYDRILYKNYFWYLDRVQQKRLFIKFNLVGKLFRKLKKRMKFAK